jgi:hypothetical protein
MRSRRALPIAAFIIVVAGLLALAVTTALRWGPFSRDVIDSVAVLPFISATGRQGSCVRLLEKAYQERFNRLAYLRTEPIWGRLRGDPRFDDLLRRIGLPI